MFDLLDIAGDGVIHESELLAASVMLDVEPAVLSQIHKEFCGVDGVLQRIQAVQLVRLCRRELRQFLLAERGGLVRDAHVLRRRRQRVGAKPRRARRGRLHGLREGLSVVSAVTSH